MTTDIKATLVKLIVLVLLILKLIVKKEAHQDKDKTNTNVILVENISHKKDLSRNILRPRPKKFYM